MNDAVTASPKQMIGQLAESLREIVDFVEVKNFGNGWCNMNMQTEDQRTIMLTFGIFEDYSEEFDSVQVYVDISLDILGEDEHPVSVQKDVRLGSDPEDLSLLKIKVEEYLEMARSPKIVVKKSATFSNRHGESHRGEVKELVDTVQEAHEWLDDHNWSLSEGAFASEVSTKVRSLDDWERKVYKAS